MATTTGWSVTCSNGSSCGVNINQETGQITFPPNNTSSSITYTITYTDSQGYCGSKTMVQPSCGGGGDCTIQLTVTGTVPVPAAGGENNAVIISHGSSPTPPPTTCTIKLTASPQGDVPAEGGEDNAVIITKGGRR